MAAKIADGRDPEIIELEFNPTDVLGLAEVTAAVSPVGRAKHEQASGPVRLHKSTNRSNGGASSPV